ncbi:hypothetical protein TSUD_276080 [Trifolium subterraneum]|uniref:TIR domain-containing protein n=1 Tax=Trifolium subterraneum TaxID=3900 RepID=A0A2Z6NC22_TRISU|nr:hypothetical protein TSUD_276080 [Trifolium subterraneum]
MIIRCMVIGPVINACLVLVVERGLKGIRFEYCDAVMHKKAALGLPENGQLKVGAAPVSVKSEREIVIKLSLYSRWCLDELVRIMECSKSIGQVVLPVFYGVDPSEVRHQNGEFGRAFQSLLTRLSNIKGLFKVLNFKSGSPNLEQERSWKAALHEVAGFAGFVVLNSRNESKAIKDIVEKIVRLVNKTDLFVANNPVGVEPRVEDMIQLLDKKIPQHFQPMQAPIQPLQFQPVQAPVQPLHFKPVQAPFQPLHFNPIQAPVQRQQFQPVQAPVQQQQFQQMQAPNLQSKDVVLIGMWGMGGIGKTTIAKAIYNKIGRNFDGRSFLANIREAWEQNIGQVSLQERILLDVCKETTNKIQNIEEGKNKLKDRLCHKKVLLVLDDVNTMDQLNALCGSRQWFGSGSRIIIITRDMHVLRGNRVDQVYTMKEMGESESIELFSWHAFKQASPSVDFAEISGNLVDYSGGLPLALEVLGSYLFDRGITEWESVLEKLKKIPNDQRMEKLKILNLSHSHSLKQTPNFSNMPNLEKLVLTDCPMLSEISPSIVHLNEVLLINLKDCVNIRSLPRSIYKLKSLNTLILSGCLKIDKLEEDLEDMKSLTTLLANNTAIARVPFSVVRSKSIGYISLCGYEGFSHDVFPAIIWSWMSPTNNLPSPFQTPAGMSSFVPLDVQNSSSHELSSISKYLPWLRCLLVECDSELQLSRDTKIILNALYASNSKELESTATSQVSNVKTSALIQCYSQVLNVKSLFIQIGMNCHVTKILKDIILQNMGVSERGGQLLPGDSYPDWLNFNFKGSSVIFEVPRVQGRNLKTMVCITYSSTPDNIASDGLKNVLVKNYSKATIQLYKREALVSFEDEEGERVVSSIEPGNKVEVVVVFEKEFVVKETIVYLVYDEPIGEKMKKCQEQEKSDIVYSGDDNEGIVRTSSPEVELVDENGGAASCCGLIKYSFRQWITDFMCRLVECR